MSFSDSENPYLAPSESDSAADAFPTVGFRWLSGRGALAVACFYVAVVVPLSASAAVISESPPDETLFVVCVSTCAIVNGFGFATAGVGVVRRSSRAMVAGLCLIAVTVLPFVTGILRTLLLR